MRLQIWMTGYIFSKLFHSNRRTSNFCYELNRDIASFCPGKLFIFFLLLTLKFPWWLYIPRKSCWYLQNNAATSHWGSLTNWREISTEYFTIVLKAVSSLCISHLSAWIMHWISNTNSPWTSSYIFSWKERIHRKLLQVILCICICLCVSRYIFTYAAHLNIYICVCFFPWIYIHLINWHTVSEC